MENLENDFKKASDNQLRLVDRIINISNKAKAKEELVRKIVEDSETMFSVFGPSMEAAYHGLFQTETQFYQEFTWHLTMNIVDTTENIFELQDYVNNLTLKDVRALESKLEAGLNKLVGVTKVKVLLNVELEEFLQSGGTVFYCSIFI